MSSAEGADSDEGEKIKMSQQQPGDILALTTEENVSALTIEKPGSADSSAVVGDSGALLGLKWKESGSVLSGNGTEIGNEALSAALALRLVSWKSVAEAKRVQKEKDHDGGIQQEGQRADLQKEIAGLEKELGRVAFAKEEWEKFNVSNLSNNSYIKFGDTHMRVDVDKWTLEEEEQAEAARLQVEHLLSTSGQHQPAAWTEGSYYSAPSVKYSEFLLRSEGEKAASFAQLDARERESYLDLLRADDRTAFMKAVEKAENAAEVRREAEEAIRIYGNKIQGQSQEKPSCKWARWFMSHSGRKTREFTIPVAEFDGICGKLEALDPDQVGPEVDSALTRDDGQLSEAAITFLVLFCGFRGLHDSLQPPPSSSMLLSALQAARLNGELRVIADNNRVKRGWKHVKSQLDVISIFGNTERKDRGAQVDLNSTERNE